MKVHKNAWECTRMTQNDTECIAAECTIMYQNAAACFCGPHKVICVRSLQNLEPGDSRKLSLWPQDAPTNLVSAGAFKCWVICTRTPVSFKPRHYKAHNNKNNEYTSVMQCSSTGIRSGVSETAYICSKMGVVQSSVGMYMVSRVMTEDPSPSHKGLPKIESSL